MNIDFCNFKLEREILCNDLAESVYCVIGQNTLFSQYRPLPKAGLFKAGLS